MVQVLMRTTMAGPEGVTRSGKVADVSHERAEELVDDGFAKYVGKAPKRSATRGGKKVETASGNNEVEQRSV
jgi:hypothetical protein